VPVRQSLPDGMTEIERAFLMKQGTIVILAATVVVVALVVVSLSGAFALTQPGYAPVGMMGGRGYGPGIMGGCGYGPGGGYRPGVMGGWRTGSQAQPINSLDQANQAFERYIDATGNTNLALDEVIEFEWNYYAIVKDNSTGRGAFELLANPQNGAVFPEMGPNMMWNTEYSPNAGYGMVGGFGRPSSGQAIVSADQAQQIAQRWLDENRPGIATETPYTFPGYYSLHITNDGAVTGMLSVNAYSGAVWYHTWHGAFVASTEY
jgi:hypothetical protein